MGQYSVVPIRSGAYHIPGLVTREWQEHLTELCLILGTGPGGFYTPELAGGSKMRLQMFCLGKHWNAKTYSYSQTRDDVDGAPVLPMHEDLFQVAQRVAELVEMTLQPDILIVNKYAQSGSKLGLHQDRDESRESIRKGTPIVSISLGDDAEFQFGGLRRADEIKSVMLKSGDAFVFGGESRLCFHGVRQTFRGSSPLPKLDGRLNLTFRKF